MKNFILCACVLIALPLFAGKRVQMEITDLQTKATQPQEMLLDATRFRINNATTAVLFLTDGGRNRIVTLDKTKNEYVEMDQQTIDQMGQAMQGVAAQMEVAMKGMTAEQRAMMEQVMKGKMPQAPAPVPATTYTAKGRGAVNGFACTNYDGMRAGQKVAEVCAAQPADLGFGAADFQVFQRMQEFTAGLMQAMQNSPIASIISPALGETGVNGFTVQRTTFVNAQATKQEVLKSITNATFTDTDFSLGNAKKTELPDLSGLAGRGGKGKGRGK